MLYDGWRDDSFPGGRPPPLSPSEEINKELCSFIFEKAKESCENGTGDDKLCKQVENIEFPSMSARQKRHKHAKNLDNPSDDEELLQDEPEREFDLIEDISDLSFVELDNMIPHQVDIEPKPLAVRGSSSNILLPNIIFVIISCLAVVSHIF